MKSLREGRSISRNPSISQGGALSSSRIWLVLFTLVGLVAMAASLLIPPRTEQPFPPAPTHYLDDQARLLSPEFASAKEQYIQHLSRTMRIAQISIVILPYAHWGDLEDFSVRAATQWKIGAGSADNGL